MAVTRIANQSVVRVVVALCFAIAVLEGFDIQALGAGRAVPTLVVGKGLRRAIAPQASMVFNFASVAGALLADGQWIGWESVAPCR